MLPGKPRDLGRAVREKIQKRPQVSGTALSPALRDCRAESAGLSGNVTWQAA